MTTTPTGAPQPSPGSGAPLAAAASVNRPRHQALARLGEPVLTADDMRAMTAERIERGWPMRDLRLRDRMPARG